MLQPQEICYASVGAYRMTRYWGAPLVFGKGLKHSNKMCLNARQNIEGV